MFFEENDALAYMRRADRREAIIHAAADLVWDQGLQAVTVRGVAEYLGWPRGHVHHLFTTLDELRAEAFWAVWGRLTPHYIDNQSGTFEDRMVSVLVGNAAPDTTPIADRIWRDALAAARMHDSVKAVLRKAMQEWLDAISNALERGRIEGDLPATADIEALARHLMSIAIGEDIISDVFENRSPMELQVDAILKALRNEIFAIRYHHTRTAEL